VAPGPTKPPLSPTGLFCLLREGEDEAESSVDNVGSANYGGSVSAPVGSRLVRCSFNPCEIANRKLLLPADKRLRLPVLLNICFMYGDNHGNSYLRQSQHEGSNDRQSG